MVHKSQQGMLTPQQICRRLQKPLLLDKVSDAFGVHLVKQYAKSVLWWYEYLEIKPDRIFLNQSHNFALVVNDKLNIINYELFYYKNQGIVSRAPAYLFKPTSFWLYHLYASLNWCDMLNKKPDWFNFINPYEYLIILYQLNFYIQYREWRVVIQGPGSYDEIPVEELTKLGTDFDESVFDIYPYEDDNSDT